MSAVEVPEGDGFEQAVRRSMVKLAWYAKQNQRQEFLYELDLMYHRLQNWAEQVTHGR